MSDFGYLTDMQDLIGIASKLPPKIIVIPGGDRPEDLSVAKLLTESGLAKRCILIGSENKIIESARQIGIDPTLFEISDTSSEEESAKRTVEIIQKGLADIILKGNISTPILNRQMLKIKQGDTLSLATLFQAPSIAGGKLMILTDAGFTTVCNLGRSTGIINNAAEIARLVLGKKRPKVALLAANEKVIPSLLSTRLAAQLTSFDWPDMDVYGPLSFDLATDMKSVKIKGLKESKGVGGNADILVCPGLDSANILYKALMSMTEYGICSTAGITLGLKVPYIILSRADSEAVKLNSVALCNLFSESRKNLSEIKVPELKGTIQEKPLVVSLLRETDSWKLYLNDSAACLGTSVIETLGINPENPVENTIQLLQSSINELLAKQSKGHLNAIALHNKSNAKKVVASLELMNVDITERKDNSNQNKLADFDNHIISQLADIYAVPVYSKFFANEAITEPGNTEYSLIKLMVNKTAETIGHPAAKFNLVLVHFENGIQISAVNEGNLIDSARLFADKTTGLAIKQFWEQMAQISTAKDLQTQLSPNPGNTLYLSPPLLTELEVRASAGDSVAKQMLPVIAHQIVREIGAMHVVAGSYVEAIVLSSSITKNPILTDLIKKKAGHLAQIICQNEEPDELFSADIATTVLKALELQKQ